VSNQKDSSKLSPSHLAECCWEQYRTLDQLVHHPVMLERQETKKAQEGLVRV
jgi:hypothetical protein